MFSVPQMAQDPEAIRLKRAYSRCKSQMYCLQVIMFLEPILWGVQSHDTQRKANPTFWSLSESNVHWLYRQIRWRQHVSCTA